MPRAAQTDKQVHPSREQEQRAAQEVHEEEETPWVQDLSLTAPPPLKGFRQRWIRFYVGGREDHTNIARKLRDGWKPRPLDTVPQGFDVPTIETGRFAGFVGVQGAVLCQMPEKRAQAREKYYRRITQARTAALDSQLQRVGEIAGGRGFGPIVAEKRSVPVREQPRVAQDDE